MRDRLTRHHQLLTHWGHAMSAGLPIGTGPYAYSDLGPYFNDALTGATGTPYGGIIEIAIELIMAGLQGRPRQDATLEAAGGLVGLDNPATRLFGLALYRAYAQANVVISTSDPTLRKEYLDPAAEQFVENMQNLGFSHGVAREALLEAMQGIKTAPIWQRPGWSFQPLPASLTTWGDARIATQYQTEVNKLVAEGKPLEVAQREAVAHTIAHLTWRQLMTIRTCPDHGECLGITRAQPAPTPPTPPNPPPNPLPFPVPEPPVQQPPIFEPPPIASDCTDPCMQTLIESLQEFFSAIAGTGSPLAALGQALPALVAALDAANLAGLNGGLQELVNCVCPKLDEISKSLADANTLADLAPADWDAIVARFGLPPSLQGLVQGSGPGFMHAVSTALSYAIFGVPPDAARKTLGVDSKGNPLGFFGSLVSTLEPIVQEIAKVGAALFADFWKSNGANVEGFWSTVRPILTNLIQRSSTGVETIPRLVLDSIEALAGPADGITPDNAEAKGLQILGFSFEVGQIFHLLAELAGKLFYPASSVWAHNASMSVSMLGYDAILSEFHSALFPNMYGTKARYNYQRKYHPRAPAETVAQTAFSRRMISQSQADSLTLLNGLDPAYNELMRQVTFRPIRAQILRRAFVNRDYPYALAKGFLEDEGYSDPHVKFMNDAMEFESNMLVEQKEVAALAAAYSKGAITIEAVQSAMEDIGWGALAIKATLHECALKRAETMIARLDTAIEAAVAAEFLTPAQAQEIFTAAGGDPSYYDTFTQLWQVKIGTRETTREQTVVRATATQTWSKSSTAAIMEFKKGVIDSTELTATLTAARIEYLSMLQGYGLPAAEITAQAKLTPLLVAAMLAQAEAAKHLATVFVDGLVLPKAEADVLKLQVAALVEQRKYDLITTEQMRAQLTALKIPADYVEAIIAKDVAAPTHPPKTEIRLPV